MSAIVWIPLAVVASLAGRALSYWVVRQLRARAQRRRLEKLLRSAFPRTFG